MWATLDQGLPGTLWAFQSTQGKLKLCSSILLSQGSQAAAGTRAWAFALCHAPVLPFSLLPSFQAPSVCASPLLSDAETAARCPWRGRRFSSPAVSSAHAGRKQAGSAHHPPCDIKVSLASSSALLSTGLTVWHWVPSLCQTPLQSGTCCVYLCGSFG